MSLEHFFFHISKLFSNQNATDFSWIWTFNAFALSLLWREVSSAPTGTPSFNNLWSNKASALLYLYIVRSIWRFLAPTHWPKSSRKLFRTHAILFINMLARHETRYPGWSDQNNPYAVLKKIWDKQNLTWSGGEKSSRFLYDLLKNETNRTYAVLSAQGAQDMFDLAERVCGYCPKCASFKP